MTMTVVAPCYGMRTALKAALTAAKCMRGRATPGRALRAPLLSEVTYDANKYTRQQSNLLRRVCAQVYYGDILPPVGSQQISYARFMDLVHRKRVKRIVLMSDGKVAMVEVPVEGYASKLDEARYDRKDEECAAPPPPLPS